MNNLYNIDRGQYNTPQEFFDSLCKSTTDALPIFNVIATIGWTNIATQIIHLKNELPFFSAGVTLSAFAINYINRIVKEKETPLSEVSLIFYRSARICALGLAPDT